MRFNLIYRTWAFQIVHAIGPWGERTGLPFWAGTRDSGVSLGLPFPWAWRVGLRAYFLNPISCLSALVYGERVQWAISFLESDATSTRLLRAELVKALSSSYVL